MFSSCVCGFSFYSPKTADEELGQNSGLTVGMNVNVNVCLWTLMSIRGPPSLQPPSGAPPHYLSNSLL